MTEEAGIEQRAFAFSTKDTPFEGLNGSSSNSKMMATFAQSEIKESVRKIVGEIRAEAAKNALHVPVAYRDHSDAWIGCSCGWAEFGSTGEEWQLHVEAEPSLAARLEKEYGL